MSTRSHQNLSDIYHHASQIQIFCLAAAATVSANDTTAAPRYVRDVAGRAHFRINFSMIY